MLVIVIYYILYPFYQITLEKTTPPQERGGTVLACGGAYILAED